MRHLLWLLLFGTGCARSSGDTPPCEAGATMCLDVVSAHIELESGAVRDLELAAILRGPFDDCTP